MSQHDETATNTNSDDSRHRRVAAGAAVRAGAAGQQGPAGGGAAQGVAGYFPALKPQFVILVKFDRPRIGENTWGSTTGAPTFKEIAQFLIDYYNIEASA